MSVNLGADPEFFIVKKNGKVAQSAHMFDSKLFNGGLEKDGFAVELHPNARYCRDEFRSRMMEQMRLFAQRFPEHDLTAIPKKQLSATSLKDAPDDVMGYGCVPDFNAYTLEEKSPPTIGYHNNNRYVGGHLHFGIPYKPTSSNSLVKAAALTIMSDIHAGIPMVAMLGNVNDYGEKDRRDYYGQAGSFRQKPYGFEYRVPSAAIFMSPAFVTWMQGQIRSRIRDTIKAAMSEERVIEIVRAWEKEFDFKEIQRIINEHDVAAAREFVTDRPRTYTNMYNKPFYQVMLNADDSGVGMNTNLKESWQWGNRRNADDPYSVGCEGVLTQDWRNRYAELVFPPSAIKVEKTKVWGKV